MKEFDQGSTPLRIEDEQYVDIAATVVRFIDTCHMDAEILPQVDKLKSVTPVKKAKSNLNILMSKALTGMNGGQKGIEHEMWRRGFMIGLMLGRRLLPNVTTLESAFRTLEEKIGINLFEGDHGLGEIERASDKALLLGERNGLPLVHGENMDNLLGLSVDGVEDVFLQTYTRKGVGLGVLLYHWASEDAPRQQVLDAAQAMGASTMAEFDVALSEWLASE